MTLEKRKYSLPAITEKAASAPLSFQQERLFFLSQLMPDSPVWNRVSVRKYSGTLEVSTIRKAVAELARRHSVLRCIVKRQQGELCQYFTRDVSELFIYTDLTAGEGREVGIQQLLSDAWRIPIQLSGSDPLFQANLVQTAGQEFYIVLKLHHIISDATTFELLWRDLKHIYNALLDPAATDLPELKLDYGNYVKWQRKAFSEEHTREQERYWLEEFKGELPILDLPTDLPAPAQVSFKGALTGVILPEELLKPLRALCLNNKAILFSGLLSVYYILLHKLARQEEVVVGTVFNGRHYGSQLSQMAGFFVNTVAIRLNVDEEQSFADLLKRVQGKVNDAYYMQDFPFERLVQAINPDRLNSRNPLYRAMFNMVVSGKDRLSFAGMEESAVDSEGESAQTDLLFDVRQDGEQTALWAEYNTDLFRKETIMHFLDMYKHLLSQIVTSPEILLKDLTLINDAEKEIILQSFNATSTGDAADKCIHELFGERVQEKPERTALLFRDQQLTYRGMNGLVNRLALHLRRSGVHAESIVAIIAERSLEMVIGIYAILKAGGAVLPIDPLTPKERALYMLEDSGASHVLLHKPEFSELVGEGIRIHPIGDLSVYADTDESTEIGCVNQPEDLAYIIYTSGSTGKPKGVMLEHRSIVNTLLYLQQTYPLEAGDTHLFKTTYTFDVSIAELFGWFFAGGRLAILEPGLERDPGGILDAFGAHKITHVNFSPSMLATFLEATERRAGTEWEQVKYVFSVGEALKPYVVKRFFERVEGTQLENMYGPTETTIYAVIYSARTEDAAASIPIGKPISNMRVYIMDKHMQLLPPGVAGELYLAGRGVGRGYLKQYELTMEKFVEDPFFPGERMYKTGDLARWRSNGILEYLGRMDQQVKVRGFRIEPGEVEQTLLMHPAVKRAIVVVKEDEDDQKRLVAYLVMQPDGHEDNWAGFLSRWLPSYMIPTAFVQLDEIPLNANGKVDIRALPAPGLAVIANPLKSDIPLTYVESKLIEITEAVLHIEGIRITDNFFELGGNSLLTIRFVTEIEEAFGISVSLLDFFDLPVLSDLAKIIEPLFQASVV
ncbi:amino acid adenylation domain-containing protein [Paenibacillus sp. FSL H8-0048]|uniref:non-ribosomal peptide synthetase n=1 Tax=Paenibacillus sp. FSL H8-0048 TaxID=2954508 RepID=UPI0030F7147A